MRIHLVIIFELDDQNLEVKLSVISSIDSDNKEINLLVNIKKIMLCSINFHNLCLFEIIIDSQSFVTSQHKIFIFQELFENNVTVKNVFLTHFYQHAVFVLQDFHYLIERILILDEIVNHTGIDSEVKIIAEKYKILLSLLKCSLFSLSIFI